MVFANPLPEAIAEAEAEPNADAIPDPLRCRSGRQSNCQCRPESNCQCRPECNCQAEPCQCRNGNVQSCQCPNTICSCDHYYI